jgi:Beta-lactamase
MTRQASRERGPGGADVIDLGSACTSYVGGRPVVETWGGIADRRTRGDWNRDTAAVMFSCFKGVLAVGVYRLDARARQLMLALGRVVGA